MNFPTVGQTAFAAITVTGTVSVFSMVAAARSESRTEGVALGVLALFAAGFNIGFVSAYVRSDRDTKREEYLSNGVSDAGKVIAAGVTFAAQKLSYEVVDRGVKVLGEIVEAKIKEFLSGDSKKTEHK